MHDVLVSSLSVVDKENIATSIRLGHSWHTFSETKRLARERWELHDLLVKAMKMLVAGNPDEALSLLKS
jgi:metallophosphoesterase superfamily enzyme